MNTTVNMEERSEMAITLELQEQAERCFECGHVWMYEEPVHFADCRYFVLEGTETDDIDESGSHDAWGWRSFRPALL